MMYSTVLILPFLSYLSTNLFGRFIGIYGSCILSTSSILLSFLFALFIFFEVSIVGSSCLVHSCYWFQSELLLISWCFYFDSVTALMLLVVSGVSSLVHIYATEYLGGDPHHGRFMSYLSLFTGFMLVLVSSDNFIVLFFGWEGIGLASFLLIGFWYNRIQAGKSAIKAMLVNRVGDLGLALGIGAIFVTFKSLDFLTVFALTPNAINEQFSFLSFSFDRLTLISLLLFWGAVGKSAQVGLHIWLPDAMEGPTPVSALIHAATLVTAGVFLMIRCSIIFENSYALTTVTVVGAFTAFFASTIGLVQNDLKRIIAYSTCSQLGYMTFAVGLSHYSIAFFHLANHALFKALLFLSAGCVIHAVSDEQDLRKFGSFIKFFPTSYAMFLIGSLALVGFPFLTGFYSKDAILEVAISKHNSVGNFAHLLGCLAAFCTSFYSFRLIYLTFVNSANGYKKHIDAVHDGPILMVFPLIFLSFGSIFVGFVLRDAFIGLGSTLFGNSIFNIVYSFNLVDSEFLSASLKNIPFFCTLFGIFLSTLLINCWYVSKRAIFQYKISSVYRALYTFLIQKWHFDQITNETVANIMFFGYRNTFQLIDKGIIEAFGPSGLGFNLQLLSVNFVNYQSGKVYNYAFFFIIGIISTLCFFFVIAFDLEAFVINDIFLIFLFSYFVFCFVF